MKYNQKLKLIGAVENHFDQYRRIASKQPPLIVHCLKYTVIRCKCNYYEYHYNDTRKNKCVPIQLHLLKFCNGVILQFFQNRHLGRKTTLQGPRSLEIYLST